MGSIFIHLFFGVIGYGITLFSFHRLVDLINGNSSYSVFILTRSLQITFLHRQRDFSAKAASMNCVILLLLPPLSPPLTMTAHLHAFPKSLGFPLQLSHCWLPTTCTGTINARLLPLLAAHHLCSNDLLFKTFSFFFVLLWYCVVSFSQLKSPLPPFIFIATTVRCFFFSIQRFAAPIRFCLGLSFNYFISNSDYPFPFSFCL